MPPPSSEGSIYISNVALEVRQKFGKPVYHVVLQTNTGSFTKEIPDELPPGYTHNEVFNPALKLSPQDQLSVSLQYRSGWLKVRNTLCITVKQSEIVMQAQNDGHGNETHVTCHRNIVVTITFSRGSVAPGHDGLLPSITGESPSDVPLSLTTGERPSDVLLPLTTSDVPPLPTPRYPPNDDPPSPITLNDDPLPSIHWSPTTSEILSVCPRFRVLIIGNTGVGKSTLIRNVFGVKDVDVSAASRGRADIDCEYIAPENKLFVVHDSVGLEAAEGDNFKKVKDFIDSRRKQENLKDRLHAVWMCLAVPYAKGRLLEAGMEELLRNRKKILGDIPIVVVLTKLDLLDNQLIMDLRREGVAFKSMEEARPFLGPRRSTFLKEHCSQPLLRAAGSSIPHVAVSTKIGYRLEPTIPELVKTTTSEIERYIKADPSYTAATEPQNIELNAPLYIAGMAQRASIEAKVDLSIEIGMKRYWTSLGATSNFSAEKVKEYLLVMHQDVIQAWNFYDPEEALQGDGLKTALLDTSDLGMDNITDAQAALRSMPSAPTMASLLNDLAAVVITLPFTVRDTLVTLCNRIPKSAKIITIRFMAYIVDLIYVMKILFILAPQGSIVSRDVALALEVYKKSSYRERVHLELNPVLPEGRDVVVDKIDTLVRRYNITDEEVSCLRSQIQAAGRS